MKTRSLTIVALAAVLTVACGADRKADPAPKPPVTVESVEASVGHVDERLGSPSFVWFGRHDLPTLASAAEAARFAMGSVAKTYKLEPRAIATLGEPEIHDVGAGAILARVKQRVGDVDVFRAGVTIAMNRSFEPIAGTGILAASLSGSEEPFVLDSAHAMIAGHAGFAAKAGQPLPGGFRHLDVVGGYERFTAPGLHQPARAKKVFFPTKGRLIPAWYTEFMRESGAAWSIVVSAKDGSVLFANDLVRNDFSYRVYADAQTKHPFDGPQGNGFIPHPTATLGGVKKLTYVPSNLVTLSSIPFSKNDPWLAPTATETNGNNVNAYTDLGGGDGYQAANDVRPVATGTSFDFTYDTSISPGSSPANIRASAVQLFYDTNYLHDWYYDSGFDEKSGNHQVDNFGRGGVGLDPLDGEAQDFAGKNNSDAATPPDGSSPRIRMYVFTGTSDASLVVSAPASIAGTKAVGIAGFGKDSFDLSGAVVLADDGTAPDANDGCEQINNDVKGKIVLVHRGLCSFIQKSQMVQAAGGIGAIIANVATSAQPDDPPTLGGGGEGTNPVTIPVLGVARGDGAALQAALAAGVTVEMKRAPADDLDGALDTSVVSHEWGHVLSNRLVGDGNGLTTNQAGGLGEGWGDFSMMMMLVRADDLANPTNKDWAGAYENGAYAMSGQADLYFGIRRVPYSTDMTKDPLTFKHISNGVPLPSDVPIAFGEDGSFNAEVHSTGEIWTTMLWECYAALLRKYPFDEAQARMKRYLVASLKLTPVDPTLLEARDAVLAAALAADESDYELFWAAYAKRGAGVGAKGPGKDSPDNTGVVESYSVGNAVEIVSATLKDDVITCDRDNILDDGEVGTITVKLRNAGVGALAAADVTLGTTTAGITVGAMDAIPLGALKQFEAKTIKVQASIHDGLQLVPIALDVVVRDPSFVDGKAARFSIPTHFDTDEAAQSSAVDQVETAASAWKSTKLDADGLTSPWARVTDGTNTYWNVPDGTEASDQYLTSPSFTVDGTTFAIEWKHRWRFRHSTRRNVDVDGGIVEITTDNGTIWKDLSTYGKVGYNTTLQPAGRGDNPLQGSPAFGNTSEGYPDAWVAAHVDVTLPAPPKSVKIRFHTGSATGFTGAPGWDVDDIKLIGISSTPFYSFVPQQDQCDPNAPTVDAGPARSVNGLETVTLNGSGSSPSGADLTFLWRQESGPPVGLTGADSANLTFMAPAVTAPTVLRFALRANDGALLSPAARVEVTVNAYSSDYGDSSCRMSRLPPRAEGAAVLVGIVVALWLARRTRRRTLEA